MRDPSSIRILVYGLDADLQTTRAMLLRETGYSVDSADDWVGFNAHLDRDDYSLVILCHTVSQEERKECEILARNKKIPLHALVSAIAPQEFIGQIAELVSR